MREGLTSLMASVRLPAKTRHKSVSTIHLSLPSVGFILFIIRCRENKTKKPIMVVQLDGQRRRRAFRKLFAGRGRGRSLLKRSGVDYQRVGSCHESIATPKESAARKAAPPGRSFHSFRLLHEDTMRDIEIKVSTREEERGEERDTIEDPTVHNTLRDEKSAEARVDNATDSQRKQSIDHHDPIWKTALANVEFQGDNDAVFTFDGSQSHIEDTVVPRDDGSKDDKVGTISNPFEFSKELVETDSMRVLDSFRLVQLVRMRSESTIAEHNPEATSNHDEKSVQGSDLETVAHSVQNETMSEMSPLTHEGTRSTTSSESNSVFSCGDSLGTALYPDILTVRTKIEGTTVANKNDRSTASEIEEVEVKVETESSSDDEEFDGDEDDDDETDFEGESELESYDDETEDDVEDEETAENSSCSSLTGLCDEDDPIPLVKIVTETTIGSDEDAFVDLPHVGSEDLTLDVDEESAYTTDDNNVPFVDPIEEFKTDTLMRTSKDVESPAVTGNGKEYYGWRLFGLLSSKE